MDINHSLKLPARWLNSPRKGRLVADKFLPFKTPLDNSYNPLIPETNRFNLEMVFNSVKTTKHKIGLWIDLTNTSRFYSQKEVESHGAQYYKLACRGFGQAPSAEQAETFIDLCSRYLAKHPDDIIAVHCTHGYNRTGFLISSYLIDQMSWSPIAAVQTFCEARPPGIYKQDYLNELFSRYDDVADTPAAPPRPDWDSASGPLNDLENEEIASNITEENSLKAITLNTIINMLFPYLRTFQNGEKKPNSAFMEGLSLEQLTDSIELNAFRTMCKEMCGVKKKSFPGSQPVSMSIENLEFMAKIPYKVSWKADGTRYMMLIHGEKVFMIDRDNRYFKVPHLTFPKRKSPGNLLTNTLLDGEMVIDKIDGKPIPRYLIYDIIMFEKVEVWKSNFDIRLLCIEKEIIFPRTVAASENKIDKNKESMSVRAKPFWPLSEAHKLWQGNFTKQLSHAMDGLVFQPINEPYKFGRWDQVLKWKPPELNSVDFKLKVVKESKYGMVTEHKGYLYVGGYEKPFAQIKVTKELRAYHDKIIECKIENNQWKFMRTRPDKSFPNHISTVKGVWQSIHQPVTAEFLFKFIETHIPIPLKPSFPEPAKNVERGVKRPLEP